MSAEAPKRNARQPSIVQPEPVIDRSIIESLTGFINEVTLNNLPQVDPKDQIQWVRFEHSSDYSNPCFGNDNEPGLRFARPLLLIIGYGTGIQAWALPIEGEAIEVLHRRFGSVRCVKVLPTPHGDYSADDTSVDRFAVHRPLMAICESAAGPSSVQQFCTMTIVSLKTGQTMKSIKFKTPILEIVANHQSVVVTFAERIAVFDAMTFEDRLTITTCYPTPGSNPVTLGPRWLAYAEKKLIPFRRSGGGNESEGVVSYTATVLNAAKSLTKGLLGIGEQVAAGLTGSSSSSHANSAAAAAAAMETQHMNAGVVMVIDIKVSISTWTNSISNE